MLIRLQRGADCLDMVQLMPVHLKTRSSLASFKSRLVLPFLYRVTQVVLEKTPLNGCSSTSSSGSSSSTSSRSSSSSTVGMVCYGMVNVNLYSAIIMKVSNALNTLVSGEKPGFQALSKGLIVLLCTEVIRQGVPDHGAVHSECSASNSA